MTFSSLLFYFFDGPEMELVASSTTGKLSITEPHPGPGWRRLYFYFVFAVLVWNSESWERQASVSLLNYALNPISEFLTAQSLLNI